jgi:hypothetical protein
MRGGHRHLDRRPKAAPVDVQSSMIPATVRPPGQATSGRRPPARAITAGLVATVLVALAGLVLTGLEWSSLATSDAIGNVGAEAGAIAYAVLGALIVRRAGNLVGWFMLAEGAANAVITTGSAYAILGVKAHPGAFPAAAAAGTLAESVFVLVPAGLNGLAVLILLLLLGSALVSLALRYRRGDQRLRQQIKWLGLAFAGLLACQIVAILAIAVGQANKPLQSVPYAITPFLVYFGIPAAMAIAILRRRLFDIDVIISRALLFTLLSAGVTAVYAAIALGIGTAVGHRNNPLLTIAAAVAIALVFQPLRQLASRPGRFRAASSCCFPWFPAGPRVVRYGWASKRLANSCWPVALGWKL